ncbi:hypothetical protein BT63DRAFT_256855 [Microthyrium microscopicum]|uniref:Guanine nucleotide-exchange factor SEC12 n=1 Tax=Microthyrium microscopicum TaxID=703497 RepID=A0A6A6UAM3_9PEZI|nr:hypothetical protein BT63DRAFT_256855 [Microthyrium microscopicum]
MPPVSYSHITLDYPPWAIEFDPYSRGYLVVGGGGGQGQKEVPNKLTVLDVSDRSIVEKAAELDVKDDSPSSLGLLADRDGLYIFCGINSTASDRKSGKNEHLRTFKATIPKDKQKASINPIGQSSLFSAQYSSSDDAYQRVLRFSPAQLRAGSKRIGAIASSLATKSEIVVFDATNALPNTKDIIHTIEPANNAEANDVDLYEQSEGDFQVAYCTRSAVYIVGLSYDFEKNQLKEPAKEPNCVSEIRSPGKVRCLRFISSNHILLLLNRNGASELVILKIYAKGGPGDVVLKKILPKRMASAVSLDAIALDADSQTGERQVVIAVAGQTRDVSILSINIPVKGSPTAFKTYADLKDIHDAPMKKVVLSPFQSPYASPSNTKGTPGSKKAADQYLRLASISLSNNVVVDALPLHPVPTKSGNPRYVLDKAGPVAKALHTGTNVFVAAFVLLISLILAQSYLDAQAAHGGQVSKYQLIPAQMRTFINGARQDNDPLKQVIHDTADAIAETAPVAKIADILHLHRDAQEKGIVVRSGDTELSTEVHDDQKALVRDPNAKRWHELTPKQQENWKRKLAKAGHWSANEGEGILKSIFFSEVAGAIGRAAMEAING